jgi:hypothetical protein
VLQGAVGEVLIAVNCGEPEGWRYEEDDDNALQCTKSTHTPCSKKNPFTSSRCTRKLVIAVGGELIHIRDSMQDAEKIKTLKGGI